MSTDAGFGEIQQAFTRHMRDPDHAPPPAGVEDRRLDIYRGLLYRNVESFMAGSFPVLRKIIPDEHWHAMIRDYFKRHRSHTPYFPRMPREFLDYLEHERDQSDDPPYISELAHYEWVETAVSIDPREIDYTTIDRNGDMATGLPVLNPLARTLTYTWPVHRISPDYQPDRPPEQPTYLVVYRDSDCNVGFLVLNPVTARLFELMQKGQGSSGAQLLRQIAAELQHPNPDTVIQGGLQILDEMRDKEVILGTHRG